MKVATCQRCRTAIIMVRHVATGKPAPIEIGPSDDGNILVTGDTYEVIAKEERSRVQERGFILRKNHFATCEFARSFSQQEQRKTLQPNVVKFPNRRRVR